MRWIKLVAVTTALLPALGAGAPCANARAVTVGSRAATPPSGFRLTPRAVLATASATKAARAARARGPLRSELLVDANHVWTAYLIRAAHPVVTVTIDDRTGQITHVWTGAAAASPLARGEHGPAPRRQHLYLVIAGFLFLLPFIDVRRPFRMLHADLLMMLGLGVYHYFFVRGDIDTAVPLLYPVLLYLLARVLWIASRGRARDSALVPHWPLRLLVGALVLLVAARAAINIFGDFGVRDGGYDSVWGAATIRHGDELYARSAYSLNVYGPTLFLSYVPFELLFPFNLGGVRGGLGAAHAATLAFDLATVAGLIVLGRRFRPGRDGTVLGVALAYAFATYPWTVAVIAVCTNDGLVPALLVWALVAARSAPVRGLLVGWAAAAKFFPLPIIPPLARSEGDGMSVRSILVYGLCAVGVVVLSTAAYLPHPGGVDQFLDLTVRTQIDRFTFLSIWKLHPSLGWLHVTAEAAAIVLPLVLYFFPRRRDVVTLAAASSAVILVQQIAQVHWFYLYASWFAPFVLITFLSPYAARDS